MELCVAMQIIEKQKLESFNNAFHKMLDNLKNIDLMDRNTELNILEINNMLERLTYKLEYFNDEFIINNSDVIADNIEEKIQDIDNDNKVIRDLIPLALMYKMLLSRNSEDLNNV